MTSKHGRCGAESSCEQLSLQHGGRRPSRIPKRAGFTLIELLVVIAVIAIVAAMLLPALGKAKAAAQRTARMNDLKEIGLSLRMYIDDFGCYPPRIDTGDFARWPAALCRYYRNTNMLVCPSEVALYGKLPGNNAGGGTGYPDSQADNAPCSYIMNGWNDVFPNQWQSETIYMKDNQVLKPADTIAIGERRHSDKDDFWMDISARPINWRSPQSHAARPALTVTP